MQFRFDEAELRWFSHFIPVVFALIAENNKDDAVKLIKLGAKLKYKVTPNASIVYLNQTERDVLVGIAEHRLAYLKERGSLSEELDLIRSVLSKLDGAKEDANEAS
jgi:hypothetical protein